MKIEKNIPLPPAEINKAKYPFRLLEVGDSFLVPFEGRAPRYLQKHLAVKGNYNKIHRMAFTTRIVEGGVRVWRTA